MTENQRNEIMAPSGQVLIYQDGSLELQVRLDGETVWLPQRQIAELYQVSVKTVSEHLTNIYAENEVNAAATIRNFQIVQIEGDREVSRKVDHYNLDAILAVGYRVRSQRGTQFRQWATTRLSELLIKGFTMDDERIKAGQTLGHDYFNELLERIREIRASERLFYQKITDIYATSVDYDSRAEVTQSFFATVQNKLHWAIHGHTAPEIVQKRANAELPNMGLTTWKNAPHGAIRKTDVGVAKNYLTHEEIDALNRIVTMYLDYAEDQAKRHKTMHMAEWIEKLDAFLKLNEREILLNPGTISHELALDHANAQFKLYKEKVKTISDFDKFIEESKKLAKSLPKKESTTKRKPS